MRGDFDPGGQDVRFSKVDEEVGRVGAVLRWLVDIRLPLPSKVRGEFAAVDVF